MVYKMVYVHTAVIIMSKAHSVHGMILRVQWWIPQWLWADFYEGSKVTKFSAMIYSLCVMLNLVL